MGKVFHSNGKLLLTGEYAVLDGALSLAVPTKYGQSMAVDSIESPQLIWKSYDETGAIWYKAVFSLNLDQAPSAVTTPISNTLATILKNAKELNPEFLAGNTGFLITTRLDFPKDWGLGTSSTLINNVAQWAEVDAFELQHLSFAGSGYDIACAQNDHPLLYSLKEGIRYVEKSDFVPSFKNSLYFVYLNKKQNSRDEISRYAKRDIDKIKLREKVSTITRKVVDCKSLKEFEAALNEHEKLLSAALDLPTAKDMHFGDFNGTIKSLGAWGGDFILATGDSNTPDYFRKKGYKTIIRYGDMVFE